MNTNLIDKYIVEIAASLNNSKSIDQIKIEYAQLEDDELYLLIIAAKQLLQSIKDAPPKKTLIKRIINE